MTTNSPEFQAHDDFIFEHKEVGKVTREEFIKYIRSSHEHMRKLSEIIQQYNQTIEDYLNEWDGNLESFDEDVKDLLGRWIQDGTMDNIINENLMSTKADKSYVDELHDSTTAQLAQTELEIGVKDNLPQWLKKSIREVTEELDNYARDISINVKSEPFLAKGDGITNDQQSFENALSYLENSGGGVLLVPDGEYMFSETLNVPSNVIIQGVGMKSSHLNFNSLPTSFHGVSFLDVENSQITRCKVTGTKGSGYGIFTGGYSKHILVSSNEISNCGGGITFNYTKKPDGTFVDSSIGLAINNHIYNTTANHGIMVMRAEKITLFNNVIHDIQDQGIRLVGAVSPRVTHNRIENVYAGIKIQGFGEGENVLKATSEFDVSNNTIRKHEVEAMSVNSSSNLGQIKDNIFLADGRGGKYGIVINAPLLGDNNRYGCKHISITGNRFDSYFRGMQIFRKNEFIHVKNNSFIDTTGHNTLVGMAIEVNDFDEDVLEGIFIENNDFITKHLGTYAVRGFISGGTIYVRYNNLVLNTTATPINGNGLFVLGLEDTSGGIIDTNTRIPYVS